MNDYKEIQEAIYACDNALRHLNQAKQHLDSAGNWGIVDMLGGGFFTTLAKHSNVDNAKQELQNAKDAVMSLKAELMDVSKLDIVDIDISETLRFTDYLFDGFFPDILVQSKIDDAKQQVNDAIVQITAIKIQLAAMLG